VAVADRSDLASLRIALVCPYSLSRPGGVQGQVVGLARAHAQLGHQVSVFAPLDGSVGAPVGVDVVPTGHSVSVPSNGSIAPVSISVLAAARALKAVESGGFDVVHLHEPFAPGLPLGLLVGRRVPPLVATFHRHGGSAAYRVLGPLARRAAGRLAVRAAVSEAARSTAAHALGGTYEVGFNGVEVDRYRDAEPWPTDRPTVLFLGRHEERKGLQVLLEAFGHLTATLGDGEVRPVLWIAGDGPQTEALRRRYPESSDVVWLGVLSEQEKVRRLAAADVLCAPSLGGESFGMIIVEAMAARTPVVASDIDGYRAAAGGCAVLVPPSERTALAFALAGVLGGRLAVLGPATDDRDTEPRQRWLDTAAQRADQWSMDRLAQWYVGLYRRAMVGSPV
jgi:phosphatidyl-myo-inositol alpha-mannosyltransferase